MGKHEKYIVYGSLIVISIILALSIHINKGNWGRQIKIDEGQLEIMNSQVEITKAIISRLDPGYYKGDCIDK